MAKQTKAPNGSNRSWVQTLSHYLLSFREFQLVDYRKLICNTLCGIENAEFNYLTFLANIECPENTDCLPNGQCLFPCQKTSDCAEYVENCERMLFN